MYITLSLTHDCNLACSYCYAGIKKPLSMSLETAYSAIDFALSGKPDLMQLGFFGGEPLLEWDLLMTASDYAQKKCNELSIPLQSAVTTNGTLLTEMRMNWFNDNGFVVAVSLDGIQKMHDICRKFVNGTSSFSSCLDGLKTALKSKPFTEVIIVVTPANVRYLGESVEYLYTKHEVRRIAINPDFYSIWQESDLETLKNQLVSVTDAFIRSYRCGAPVEINILDNKITARVKNGLTGDDHCQFGRNEFAIAASGNIYPCERLIGDDTDTEICFGSVQKGFDESKRIRFKPANGCINPECSSCSIRYICQSTCGCVNYALTGNINKTDGVVCYFEKVAADAADRAATTLFNEGNRLFLKEFYNEDKL